VVWSYGSGVVWWYGGKVVWYGGMVEWRCGGMVVRWCGGEVEWKRRHPRSFLIHWSAPPVFRVKEEERSARLSEKYLLGQCVASTGPSFYKTTQTYMHLDECTRRGRKGT